MIEIINIQKFKREIKKPWKPIDVLELNNQILRIALFVGEYHWHFHENEDELFLVDEGEITIEIKNQPSIHVKKGEMVVIPKGIHHKPRSNQKSFVILFEPKTINSKGD